MTDTTGDYGNDCMLNGEDATVAGRVEPKADDGGFHARSPGTLLGSQPHRRTTKEAERSRSASRTPWPRSFRKMNRSSRRCATVESRLPHSRRAQRASRTMSAASSVTTGAVGLRIGEADTIASGAAGLVRYSTEVDEDEGVRAWAEAVVGWSTPMTMDPYVGAVNGIGPALFAFG